MLAELDNGERLRLTKTSDQAAQGGAAHAEARRAPARARRVPVRAGRAGARRRARTTPSCRRPPRPAPNEGVVTGIVAGACTVLLDGVEVAATLHGRPRRAPAERPGHRRRGARRAAGRQSPRHRGAAPPQPARARRPARGAAAARDRRQRRHRRGRRRRGGAAAASAAHRPLPDRRGALRRPARAGRQQDRPARRGPAARPAGRACSRTGRSACRCCRAASSRGEGIDDVRAALSGNTCVFVGQSGVGKSSLLNALDGDAAARGRRGARPATAAAATRRRRRRSTTSPAASA